MKKTKNRLSNPALWVGKMPLCLGLVVLAAPIMVQASESADTKNISVSNSTRHRFLIKKQPLYSALNALAEQGGVQFVYTDELVRGLSSPGANGQLSTEEALRQVLADSGLDYRHISDNTITLAANATGEKSIDKKTYSDIHSDAAILPPVKVTSNALNGLSEDENLYSTSYNHRNSTTATKTKTPLIETPMSVQVVPQQVLKDQQAVRMEDALKNVSGVVTGYGFGGLEDTFIIRGFENSTNSWSLTEVYRDGALVVEGLFSLADVERVEVLKGPAAMLYGRLQPGGLINVTTKRPQKEAAYSIEQKFGSFSTYRTTASATGAMTKDGNLTYRLDFEYLDKDSFRDFAFNEQTFLAPKISWQITDNTRLDAEYIHFQQNAFTDWGLPVIGNRVVSVPIDRSFQEPTDNYYNNFDGGGITLTHNFNVDWTFQGKFFKYSEAYGGPDHSPGALNASTGNMARSYYDEQHLFDSTFGMANLTGKFATWGLDHTLLLGWDYFDSGFNEDGVSLGASNGIAPINIYQPIYGQSTIRPTANNSSFQIEDGWYGFYLQDQIHFAKDWHLLAGFRYDDATSSQSFVADRSDYKEDNDGEFSPRVGLLYHPLSWLSVFGSYVEGYHHSNIGQTSNSTNLLPEESRQFEGGLKGEWWGGKLTSTLTFYHLTKQNVTVPNQDPLLAQKGYVDQVGEARSQGIEFDLSGQIKDDWRIITSYALTDARITQDRSFDSQGIMNAGNQGNRLPNVPEHSGSFWIQHDFNELGFRGLSGGLGVYFASEREGNRTNSFQMPSYARLDAMLRYSRNIGKSKFSVQFNAQNITDEEYFVAARNARSVTPAIPVNFIGSIRLDF